MAEELLRKNALVVGYDCLRELEEDWLPVNEVFDDFMQDIVLAFQTLPGFCGFTVSSADYHTPFPELLEPGEYFIRLSTTRPYTWSVIYSPGFGRRVSGNLEHLLGVLKRVKVEFQLSKPLTLLELIKRREKQLANTTFFVKDLFAGTKTAYDTWEQAKIEQYIRARKYHVSVCIEGKTKGLEESLKRCEEHEKRYGERWIHEDHSFDKDFPRCSFRCVVQLKIKIE